MQISMFRDSILYCHWKAGLPWTPLEGKILLEDRTCPGYSVSCTSCNLCKDDGVVHACAVCFTNSVGGGDLLKRKLCFTVHGYSSIMQISVLFINCFCHWIAGLAWRTGLPWRTWSLEGKPLLTGRPLTGRAFLEERAGPQEFAGGHSELHISYFA